MSPYNKTDADNIADELKNCQGLWLLTKHKLKLRIRMIKEYNFTTILLYKNAPLSVVYFPPTLLFPSPFPRPPPPSSKINRATSPRRGSHACGGCGMKTWPRVKKSAKIYTGENPPKCIRGKIRQKILIKISRKLMVYFVVSTYMYSRLDLSISIAKMHIANLESMIWVKIFFLCKKISPGSCKKP